MKTSNKKDNDPLSKIKKDYIKMAKDLTYEKIFPEIKQLIKNATSEDELSNIMCTYRKKLIDNEQSIREKRYIKKKNQKGGFKCY